MFFDHFSIKYHSLIKLFTAGSKQQFIKQNTKKQQNFNIIKLLVIV
jgi:hypothetical protein